MNNRIDFLGIPVDTFTFQETLDRVDSCIKNEEHINHTVINAGKVVLMQKDEELHNSVSTCDIISPDGMAIVWASKFLKNPLPERVNGTNLMEALVELAHKKDYKVFFFGAKEEIVVKVVEHYSNLYSPKVIAGYRNGYFTKDQEPEIAKSIADSGANILFVAITSPIKENFLYSQRKYLTKVNFTMGVGGSFDVIAGLVKRAPVWMQNAGLEWFYRLIQEPKRMWKRYLIGNSKFIMLVLNNKFRKSKVNS